MTTPPADRHRTPALTARWSTSKGMPLRTRLLGVGLALNQRTPLADLSSAELDKRRALTPAAKPPITWVTGAISPQVSISTKSVPTRGGRSIPVRVLRTSDGSDSSGRVLIWLHGGGWTLGRPRDFDSLLSFIVAETGCVAFAPDYRLAPEHKAPAAVHDAIDTLDWLARGGAAALTGDEPRIAVGGDSAGGNLAALAALHARDNDLPLSGQLLSYPATELDATRPYRNAPMLSGPDMDAFEHFYLGDSGLDGSEAEVSPGNATDHTGVAPALVQTAELDPLRPEGARYAELLEQAGVSIRYTCYRGAPHGFLSMPGATHIGYQARWELVDTLQRWWR